MNYNRSGLRVDIEGNLNDENTKRSLHTVARETLEFKVLGSYKIW